MPHGPGRRSTREPAIFYQLTNFVFQRLIADINSSIFSSFMERNDDCEFALDGFEAAQYFGWCTMKRLFVQFGQLTEDQNRVFDV